MKIKKVKVSLLMVFAIAVAPLCRSMFVSSPEDANLHTLSYGPGADNLSLGDQLAIYQWGLKNDGEFRLIETTNKFKNTDAAFQGKDASSTAIAIPKQPEPGNYNHFTTCAKSGIDINILPAWKTYDAAQTKRPVTVAIIDTGIDTTHPELANALWTNTNEIPGDGIDNDSNGYIDDIHGWNFFFNTNTLYDGTEDTHGTHAAGTIAATRKSGGIAGITDNNYVKIMALKALGTPQGLGSPEDVIAAIHYAEANGASICNLSFGTLKYNKELDEAVKNSKMLFIVAAGNGDSTGTGYDIDALPIYPASLPYDNVISVANLMFEGTLDHSSNYGAAGVDIAAPGTYILSTLPNNNYGFMSGTSMAAPMVTGVAAMLYSYRPDLTLPDVKNTLMNSAKKLDSLSGKVVSGGILDAYGALTFQQ